MYPRILHIYGPIWINSYGLMIAIGFFLFLYFTLINSRRKKLISTSQFLDTIFIGLLAGIVGGRLLFVLENLELYRKTGWADMFYPWSGGFSILGTIITILVVMPFYLKRHKIKILPFLDLIAIYAPLLQSISRIGCFLAGCCYGKVASDVIKWSVCYSNKECLAPLSVHLHPTQLYSCLASFIIFLIIRFIISPASKKQGQIIFSYLVLESISRFVVDFWRGDRTFVSFKSIPFGDIFSFYQMIALALFVVSLSGLIVASLGKRSNS